MIWQIQDAKNRLSEVIACALKQGPQLITKHGEKTDDVYLSVIPIGEIVKGIEKLSKSKRKQELLTWLREDLLVRFNGKMIALDSEVLVEWGMLTARLEASGRTMPAIASLIAATVLTHQATLVTRNVDDFAGAGVDLVNPWK